jgi:hypothetical protein
VHRTFSAFLGETEVQTMVDFRRRAVSGAVLLVGAGALVASLAASSAAAEPPARNPFAPRPAGSPSESPPAINPFGPIVTDREDTVPGYLELSDGTVRAGMIYLTRDVRLQIYDEKLQRQREVPLRVVKQIDCKVLKEWMEREWKFKDAASATKMYTGREYPAREYVHVITLQDGRTIEGGLSGVVYVQERLDPSAPGGYRPVVRPEKYILYKRNKGELGENLKDLVYVKAIKLGEEAFQEGVKKAARKR